MDTQKLKADLIDRFTNLCDSKGVKWEKTDDTIKVDDVVFQFDVIPVWNEFTHKYDQFNYKANIIFDGWTHSYIGQIMDIDWNGDVIPIPRQHDFVVRMVKEIEAKQVWSRNETLSKLA